MATEPSKTVKGYKDETHKLQEKVDEYDKTVGQLTVENNWMRGKSPRLNFIINDTNSNTFSKISYTLTAS